MYPDELSRSNNLRGVDGVGNFRPNLIGPRFGIEGRIGKVEAALVGEDGAVGHLDLHFEIGALGHFKNPFGQLVRQPEIFVF